MYHFEKNNSKIFSPEGLRENVWGFRENVSPDPAVALDGPGNDTASKVQFTGKNKIINP